jgi:putative hydrolase of the HAD superfamily
MSKPDLRIFEFAIDKACKKPADCVMIGDRLDTDIAPAKKIGMKTIRTTNSLFSLQEPRDPAEIPDYTVSRLAEIPEVLNRIIG